MTALDTGQAEGDAECISVRTQREGCDYEQAPTWFRLARSQKNLRTCVKRDSMQYANVGYCGV